MSKENPISFVMYLDSLDILDDFDTQEKADFIDAIRYYHTHNELPTNLSKTVRIGLKHLIQQFERDKIKWREIKEKRAIAGRQGAIVTNARHKSANADFDEIDSANDETKPSESANADFDEIDSANPPVTVTVTKHVTVTNNIITDEKDKKITVEMLIEQFPFSLFPNNLQEDIVCWIKHRFKKKQLKDIDQLKSLARSLLKDHQEGKDVGRAIHDTISNPKWQGLTYRNSISYAKPKTMRDVNDPSEHEIPF